MYLMYYLDDAGNRVYTLLVSGRAAAAAGPRRLRPQQPSPLPPRLTAPQAPDASCTSVRVSSVTAALARSRAPVKT